MGRHPTEISQVSQHSPFGTAARQPHSSHRDSTLVRIATYIFDNNVTGIDISRH